MQIYIRCLTVTITHKAFLIHQGTHDSLYSVYIIWKTSWLRDLLGLVDKALVFSAREYVYGSRPRVAGL